LAQALRVLNVEDSKRDAALLRRHLLRSGYDVVFDRVATADAMRAALKSQVWDVIITDYSMPQFGALQAIAVLKEAGLDIPFIIVSGTVGEELAVQAMHAGADDYVMKDNLARLVPAIERELDEARNRKARKQAEEAMRASEERYRLLFESNPHPTYVFDRETLRFLAVNEAMVNLYGYSREEFAAMTVLDIRPQEDIPALLRAMSEWQGSGHKGTWKHRKRDGALIDMEVTDQAVVFDGRPSYLVLAHNVTEQRRLEAQFRQAQKMEAIGQLAGGVAHDFNNLLTVIAGYTQLSMARIQEGDPLHNDLDQVLRAARRASALTRQLLAFSRKQAMQMKSLDLNSIVSELEKMLRRLIGEDVLLKTVLAPDLGKIEADSGQIEQAIMNLVVNARDAMPAGGKLTIETSNLDLTEEYARARIGVQAGPYVMLAVSDTGVGMDTNTQARIFEPFFTTKELGKGTGLGLSTVYGIVKQCGGSIGVYSEAGHGTSFKLYFPRARQSQEEARPNSESASALRGTETILLVEDDEMVRALARQVLERYGYEVLEAPSGSAALTAAEQHAGKIDLVIADVVMPEVSGRHLVDRVLQLRPNVSVVFISGYTDAAIVHQGVVGPDTPFLQKPFTAEALARKVREVLDRRST
jgi:two-component system, cell cycle sensor histidine kinase and response regulator CckA